MIATSGLMLVVGHREQPLSADAVHEEGPSQQDVQAQQTVEASVPRQGDCDGCDDEGSASVRLGLLIFEPEGQECAMHVSATPPCSDAEEPSFFIAQRQIEAFHKRMTEGRARGSGVDKQGDFLDACFAALDVRTAHGRADKETRRRVGVEVSADEPMHDRNAARPESAGNPNARAVEQDEVRP